MRFAYPVGFVGWKFFARLGVPLRVRVFVMYDDEAKVFVATSDDFLPEFGLTVESDTWDGIFKEIHIALEEAEEICLGKADDKVKLDPVLRPIHQLS